MGSKTYIRTTGASRRAAKTTKFVHVSQEFVVNPAHGIGLDQSLDVPPYLALRGQTYKAGRNESKRKDRRADIKARVAARRVRG